jgi:fatty acid synthase, animal type
MAIFITGFSGRFPKSNSIKDFYKNLYEGIDMVSVHNKFPKNYENLPEHAAVLDNLDKFDYTFFGITKTHANYIDCQIRLLLESTFEAIIDAGLNIDKLRGENVGVYIASCSSDFIMATLNKEKINGYENVGSARSMFSNRISFHFNITGPSITIDTACSSSMTILNYAVNDILSGRIDRAIVGGANILFAPSIWQSFNEFGMLSHDGSCKPFDIRADGYGRSESVAVLVLESDRVASKGYAKIISIGINNDGYKSQGITYPNSKMQAELFNRVLSSNHISASDIEYVETHGTGTQVGDYEELSAVDEIYGKAANRSGPVLIGSIKSNVGHTEGCSGLLSLIKILMMYTTGIIPANLHFKGSKYESILSGRLKVVDKNTLWNRGLTVVSNYGFGGSNAHMILSKGFDEISSDQIITTDNEIYVFGRNKDILEKIQPNKLEWSKWLINASNIKNFPWRGIIKNSSKENLLVSNVEQKYPLVFSFMGQGSQWNLMAKDLYETEPIFRETIINACHDFNEFDVNEFFKVGDKWEKKEYSAVGIILVQIGLVALLIEKYGLVPDYLIGHSLGEIGCAYADNYPINSQIFANLSFKRSQIVSLYADKLRGSMISVGMGYEEAKLLCQSYDNIVIACINSPKNITLAGDDESILKISFDLKTQNIFFRQIDTDHVAYHSKMMKGLYETIFEEFKQVLGDKIIPRSSKWISSTDNGMLVCDAKFFAKNMCDKVLYSQAVKALPPNAIVLEIGPHSLLKSIITTTRNDLTVIPLMVKRTSSIETLKKAINELWLRGFNIKQNIIETIILPSDREPFYWNHTESLYVPTYTDYLTICSEKQIVYDLLGNDSYLMNHIVNQTALFPAVGHIYTLWSVVGRNNQIEINDLKITKPILLTPYLENDGKLKFIIQQSNEDYAIFENHDLVCTAKCRIINNGIITNDTIDLDDLDLTQIIDGEQHYQLISRVGYNYQEDFRGIIRRSWCGTWNEIQATNWISFLDNMSQCSLVPLTTKKLLLSVYIKSIKICPPLPILNDESMLKNDLFVVKNEGTNLKKTKLVSRFVEINDLETLEYVNMQPQNLVEAKLEFFPYGQHLFQYEQNYKQQMLDYMRKSYIDFYDGCHENIKNKYPHLKKIYQYATSALNCDKINYDAITTPWPLKSIFDEVYKDLTKFDDILLRIGQCPSHDNFYFTEPSQILHKEQIEVMAQIIYDGVGKPFNIMEIGTGTGGLTKQMYSYLHANNYIDKYTATDINTIKPFFPEIIFERYDINTQWKNQSVDLIVSGNALHTCKNLVQTLQYLYEALNDTGFLLLFETINGSCLYLWGLSESIWNLATDHRDYGLWNSKDTWLKLFDSTNLFKPVCWFVDDKPQSTIIILCQKNTNLAPIHVSGWKDLQSLINKNQSKHIKCTTPDEGYIGTIKCLKKEPIGQMITYSNIENDQSILAMNIFDPKTNSTGCYICKPITSDNIASFPNNIFYLEITKPGDLTSLRWVNQNKQFDPQVKVEYASLNFRDIMITYGKLNLPIKGLGLEYSGYLGDLPIMGLHNPSITTYLPMPNIYTYWEIPPYLSMAEAITIPVAYSTAYYSLICKGNLVEGQTALIHSITGSVGLASYYICKHRKIKIMATCSNSQQKRAYVKNVLGIDEKYIFDSHTTDFRDEILKLTNGEGVDLVLNSLAGDKLLASIECVKKFGHFCEIGKYDIQQNTALGMKLLQKYISVHTIDMDSLLRENSLDWIKVYDLVNYGLESKEIHPLAHTEYDASVPSADNHIEKAIRFMASGKHIGKIIIKVGDNMFGQFPFSPKYYTCGTHIVVGGLGGFGLELVEWLIEHGAKKVVITSRGSTFKNDYQKMKLSQYTNDHSPCVILENVDTVDEGGCERILKKYGDIIGVWNVAMILNDVLFENMTENKWNTTVNVKKQICQNLDKLTRKWCLELEQFVMFSSIASHVGSNGQTNYAYGNSSMEQICRTRANDKLPAISIAWGPIDDVGYIAGKYDLIKLNPELQRFEKQKINSCLNTLEKLIMSGSTNTLSYVISNKHASNQNQSQSLAPLEKILRLLGMNADQLDNNLTLSNIGVDSLQMAEIHGILKQHHIIKSLAELGQLPCKDILKL